MNPWRYSFKAIETIVKTFVMCFSSSKKLRMVMDYGPVLLYLLSIMLCVFMHGTRDFKL